ncbi:MAG: hypothetical protein CMG60_07095 [Candidatus Marinimicrobia bacterium]|nr:hypothetical protein [Candidatus Neomarinimicrobiota bacterium]
MKKIFQFAILSACLIFGQTLQEIEQAKKIISQTGMTKDQVIDAAKARGYTEKEINAAIEQEQNSSNSFSRSIPESSENVVLPELGKSNEISHGHSNSEIIVVGMEKDEIEIIDESVKLIDKKFQSGRTGVSYFGYDIFKKDPALFQATSVGAVDPDYLIGPSDEIIVMLWGETQFRQVLKVDREGFVFIPEIGQVFVNGLDLNLLESKLFRVFSQSYASLNPQGSRTPTTFLDVSLGNLRPLRIQVLGEIAQPGAYTVSPSATLFSALYYFNGPTFFGSLRDIQLIRGDKKIASIDFYDYLLTGKKPKDQKLQLDDVIFIPPRLKTVSIEGAVKRNGIYELKHSENLNDLIDIAGGLKVTAYLGRSQIDRVVPFSDREKLGMDRRYIDLNLSEVIESKEGFLLQDEDHIQIFSVFDSRQNVVELIGAVIRPGYYDTGGSLKLSQLIDNADGLLGDAYLERVDVVRVKSDFTEELIKLNLGQAIDGDPKNDIELQGSDRVRVYGMEEMVSQTYVSIEGHVKTPGRFELKKNMTVYDLIFKAGGILDEEYNKKTYLERADLIRLNDDGITSKIKSFNLGKLLQSPESKLNLVLKPNDIIRVYEKEIFIFNKPVSIQGSIRLPGNYSLKTGMNLKDLILESGGLNKNIYRFKVEIARIDPFNKTLNQHAEVFNFEMDKNFELVNNTLKNNQSRFGGNFGLMAYDMVHIRPDPYFINQKNVAIKGQVMYPGDYAIIKANEKITDIIKRSGGLLPNANPDASQYVRDGRSINISLKNIINDPRSKLNFKIQDGDEIIIRGYTNIVSINGEVNSPGFHKHIPNKRLRYYLNQSGGFSPDADKNNIWIEFPNGNSKKYNNLALFSPKVPDGSLITIGKKKEEEPFDHTEYAKELTSIIANLAQAIGVVVLANR